MSMNLEVSQQESCFVLIKLMVQDVNSACSPDQSVLNFSVIRRLPAAPQT